MKRTAQKTIKQIALFGAIAATFAAAIVMSQWLSSSPQAVEVIERTGYLGLIILGIIGGLNVVIPIPPATFSALYSAAGLATGGIILALAFGTLIADLIGFWFGTKARPFLEQKYPKIVAYAHQIATERTYLIIPFVTLYAAFVPFPNEAFLIPLAVAGIRFRYLLLPLIVGNILHQTILILGIDTLTQLAF